MTTSQTIVVCKYNNNYYGNVDFYNEPKYREANKSVCRAHTLLMELGLTEDQAYTWIKGWLYPVDGN